MTAEKVICSPPVPTREARLLHNSLGLSFEIKLRADTIIEVLCFARAIDNFG